MKDRNAARIGGDDYQHLYSWWLALALKFQDEKIARVIIEDRDARSVDDVTVRHEMGTSVPDRFYQVKYHVDNREEYSADRLIKPEGSKESMLEKFWQTWLLLRKNNPVRAIELYLVSNWTWGQDKLGEWVGGPTDRIKIDEFFDSGAPTDIQNIRASWQKKLNASNEDFREFISCLHFRLGYSASVLVNEQVVERMRHLGLKTDQASLVKIVGIVHNWLIAGQHEITLDILNDTLKANDLYLPVKEEQCQTIYMESIAVQKFERDPDYTLAWRDYFVDGPNGIGGHQLKDPDNWNAVLLPQLSALQDKINRATDCRFIRVRGKARNSCWFAFGAVFSETAGYTLEVGQAPGVFWRTDASASGKNPFKITSENESPHGEILHERDADTVAIGISVNYQLDDSVRRYLIEENKEKVSALLLLTKIDIEQKIQNAGEVVDMAVYVKRYARDLVNHWRARRLLIFYLGPAGGACIIGHQLNAIRAEIQIMEDLNPGYAPSFLLSNR